MTVYETECDGATFGRGSAPADTWPERSIGARGPNETGQLELDQSTRVSHSIWSARRRDPLGRLT
jgi:hypothetical protein